MFTESFFAGLLPFLSEYKWTFLFYAALLLTIYAFRAKFDWQAKFIGLYRTKVGLKLMDRLGKHERFFKVFGDLAILFGFLGMLFIMGILAKGLYDLLFVAGAPPVISPVLPGITIPGVGIKVPLIIGWIALFAVIIIHEFSHGVVARAYKIPVKSSGLMVFGPLGGAFVEPDEKLLQKKGKRAQLAIFAAGPFSNLVLAVVAILLLSFLFAPAMASMVADNGILFDEVRDGFPAAEAGLQESVVYSAVNGVTVANTDEFFAAIEGVAPGDTVTFSDGQTEIGVVAGEHPEDPEKGYLGVILGLNLADPSLSWLFSLLGLIIKIFTWIFILSLGIGLANLLPIGPVDGGRMFQVASIHLFGEKRGSFIWAKMSLFLIVLLVILLFVPIIKSFF